MNSPETRLKIHRKSLVENLKILLPIIKKRSPKPDLVNILVESGSEGSFVSATDLEVSIRLAAEIECEGPPARFLIPPDRINLISTRVPDLILSARFDADNVVLSGARSSFTIATANPDLYPDITGTINGAKGHKVSILAEEFRRAIDRTIYATDVESTRYALGGCLIAKSRGAFFMVGTDGRRLAEQRLAITEDSPWPDGAGMLHVLPVSALKQIKSMISTNGDETAILNMTIGLAGSTFSIDGFGDLHTRMVEGRYPLYDQVFPATPPVAKIPFPVGELMEVIAQSQITTSDESRGVDFRFGGTDGLVLESFSANVGKSRVTMPSLFSGPEVIVAFDPEYMNGILNSLDVDSDIRVDIVDGKNAVVIYTDDGLRACIMPLTRER